MNFYQSSEIDFHKKRRQELLKKYPQIRALMRPEKKTAFIVLALFLLQMISVFFVQRHSTMLWFVCCYTLGATINHSLFTAIHEISHAMVFKSKRANRWFALFTNLPLGLPVAISFEKYHSLHHRYLGVSDKDPDLPLFKEAFFFNTRLGKLLWLMIQPLTYSLRPLIKVRLKPTPWEYGNILLQLFFNLIIVYLFGFSILMYLILATIFALSIHPFATHFIGEHYMAFEHQETYSYYGIMNKFLFNFGYHVEHHDFPSIPWTKIHCLKKIAPEYYDSLYAHHSWIIFTCKFVFSKKLSLFSRVIRVQ